MLETGLVLALVGAVLYWFGSRPEAGEGGSLIRILGVVAFVVGLVFLILWAINRADAEAAIPVGLLLVGMVGAEHAHAAEGAPGDPVGVNAGSLSERQPVLVAFLLGAIPLVLSALTGLLDVFEGVPDWIAPTLATIGTVTTGLAALWAKLQVTPTAIPRTDEGEPLVPVSTVPAGVEPVA
jgi:heme A synthase